MSANDSDLAPASTSASDAAAFGALPPDPNLFEAARKDADYLRRTYILAVRTLEKVAQNEEELRAAQAQLDHARATLVQALSIMDTARGDYWEYERA